MAPADAWCRRAGRGPFRTGVRWNAAVDRLSGASERHADGLHRISPGFRVVDGGVVSRMMRRAIAGRIRSRQPSACWPIPVSAANVRAAGAVRRRRNLWKAALPEMIIQERARPEAEAAAPVVEAVTPGVPDEPSPVPPMQEPPEEAPPATEPEPDPLPDTEPGPPPPPASRSAGMKLPDPDPEPTLPPRGRASGRAI